jgi:hypothetical protein
MVDEVSERTIRILHIAQTLRNFANELESQAKGIEEARKKGV